VCLLDNESFDFVCLVCVTGADDLSWLPEAASMPENLRVVVSSRSVTTGHGVLSPAAALQRMGYAVKPLPRLKDADSRLILTSVLARYGIELQPTALSSILTKRWVGVCVLRVCVGGTSVTCSDCAPEMRRCRVT
jgi:hypothetical protein